MPKRDETAYELTEDGRRSMYSVLPKGTVVSGDDVKEYGWEKITKKASEPKGAKTSEKDLAPKSPVNNEQTQPGK